MRFRFEQEAVRSVRKLNGLVISGSKLAISMAKYQKGGVPVAVKPTVNRAGGYRRTGFKLPNQPSLRDTRTYSEVLLGKKPLHETTVRDDNVPPVQLSIIVSENVLITEKQERAVIVEYAEDLDPKQAASLVVSTIVPVACMSSLSHSILILFFDTELDMRNAMDKESPLLKIFADVRRWSEGECYKDRLVWIECFGLHPKCWCFENFKTIGEKWGRVLQVDHDYNGVNSLTFARILTRTKVQNKIEACIRIEWDSGCCDVWVKEAGCYACKTVDGVNQCTKNRPIWEEGDSFCEGLDCGQHTKEPESYIRLETVGACSEENLCMNTQNLIDDGDKGGDIDTNAMLNRNSFEGDDYGRHAKNSCDTQIPVENHMGLVSGNSDVELVQNGDLDGAGKVFRETYGNREDEILPDDPLTQFLNVDDVSKDENKRLDHTAHCELVARCSNALPSHTLALVPMNGLSDGLQKNDCCGHVPEVVREESMVGIPVKRPRGRPKKSSMPLCVPQTVCQDPHNSLLEVDTTWNTAKLIGIKALNEEAVIAELRKSRRLMVLEEQNPTMGCL